MKEERRTFARSIKEKRRQTNANWGSTADVYRITCGAGIACQMACLVGEIAGLDFPIDIIKIEVRIGVRSAV